MNNQSSDNISEYQSSEVQPPWKRAQSGSIWCKWQNVPNDISSQLRMENGFTRTIDSHSCRVKRNEDGIYIVFRNTPRNASTKRPEDTRPKNETDILSRIIQYEQELGCQPGLLDLLCRFSRTEIDAVCDSLIWLYPDLMSKGTTVPDLVAA